MNPFPLIAAAAVVAVVPPLRKRVAPIARAAATGSVGVIGAALGGTIGVLDAAINGPQPTAAES